MYLHLYLNAFEGEHSTFFTEKRKLDTGFRSGVGTRDGEWGYIELRSMTQNGAKAPWHFVQPDNGLATDRTVVRADLPQAVAPGETTLDIRFFDQLLRVIARTGYFLAASTWWASGSPKWRYWNCPASVVPRPRAGTRTDAFAQRVLCRLWQL